MNDITKEEITGTSPEIVETQESTEQDTLKLELEKVQKREGKTELEKAAFTIKKTADRIKELGGDPTAILGIDVKETSEDEDDKPVTLGMLKRLELEKIGQTALQLAESIESEAERELTKYHLENTIKTTGNPNEDLSNARAIVNAHKNKQIIEEVARKPIAKTHSSESSAPLKQEDEFVPTSEEATFMRQFGLSKEEIIKARQARKG